MESKVTEIPMPAFPLSFVQWMIPAGLAPRSESICSHPFFFLRGDPSPLYIVEMKHHLWPLAERGGTSKQGVPPPEQKCDFSMAVIFLCPQRMLRGLNRDRCSCSLRSSPILWFYDSCFPKMCSLQFELHRFTQALSLNSFFSFFFSRARGRWEEAIVPQLLPIPRWLTFKYKEKSAKCRICEGGREISKETMGMFETKVLLFIVGFVLAFPACKALQTSTAGT